MMSRVRLAVVVVTAVVLGPAGIGQAPECEGRLVSQGASPWDGQAICLRAGTFGHGCKNPASVAARSHQW
jgi:hypothetical protein